MKLAGSNRKTKESHFKAQAFYVYFSFQALELLRKILKRGLCMNFGGLKIAGLSWSNNLENTVFQTARLLRCHCRLIFKLDSLRLQRIGHICSKN